MINRRNLLLGSAGALLAGNMFKPSLARACTSNAKYMVCVFLFGGMDAFDTLYPVDPDEYSDLVAKRPNIITAYENLYSPRDPSLANEDEGPFTYYMPRLQGHPYALPREMVGMVDMFNNGDMSIVANVGPLIEPTTKTAIDNKTANLPPKLYSHNDQQSTWLSFKVEGQGPGWGGQFLNHVTSDYKAIDFFGGHGFLNTDTAAPFAANIEHDYSIDILNRSGYPVTGISNYLRIRDFDWQSEDPVQDDLTKLHGNGVRANDELLLVNFSDPSYNITNNSKLGPQLKAAAQMILTSDPTLPTKQILFVGLGGFDTHSGQAAKLMQLQADLSQSLTEFRNVMTAAGVWDDVVVFTASDFGRTLQANGDGTDHGWGSHQFILGGRVNGGQIHGTVPVPDLSQEYFTGNTGRLIPQTPLQHYVEALGGWFEVPNLGSIVPTHGFGPGPNIIPPPMCF